MVAVIDYNLMDKSNGEYYIAYINEIEDNENLNAFKEYVSILPPSEVEANPEKYLNYKGSLLLPWEEDSIRNTKGGSDSDELKSLRNTKGGSDSDEPESLRKDVTALQETVAELVKAVESLTKTNTR